MYATIRRYTGATELIDQLQRKHEDVERIIGGTPGFVSYVAIRSGDGLTTVTVCEDRAGAEESTRRAATWVRENLKGNAPGTPDVTGGDVFIEFGSRTGAPAMGRH